MKGPLSADRLFFISSLLFAAGFVLYYILGYVWPAPMLSEDLLAQLPPDPFDDPFSFPGMLNQFNWFLSIAGVVTFALGLVARKS